MAKKKVLPEKVRSLGELRKLARTDERYKELLHCAAENLGAPKTNSVDAAYQQLLDNASAVELENEGMDGERLIVDEVNFCRDLI